MATTCPKFPNKFTQISLPPKKGPNFSKLPLKMGQNCKNKKNGPTCPKFPNKCTQMFPKNGPKYIYIYIYIYGPTWPQLGQNSQINLNKFPSPPTKAQHFSKLPPKMGQNCQIKKIAQHAQNSQINVHKFPPKMGQN